MSVRTLHASLLLAAAVAGAGCAATATPLAGEHTARVQVSGDDQAGPPPAVVPVEHLFELSNRGDRPVVIVSSRTRIDTVWRFADTGRAVLPRTVGPGETLPVAVTAKFRGPGPRRHYVELQLAAGTAVRLELLVDG